jgi:hypothetical protein
MTVTFDGQILSNASPFKNDRGIQVNETDLQSGELFVSGSTKKRFRPSFKCYTEDINELIALDSKIGTFGTLVIDSASYTNCMMTKFVSDENGLGKYPYEIAFTQHTA